MTLSKHAKFASIGCIPVTADFDEATAAETAEGTFGTDNLGEALAIGSLVPADGSVTSTEGAPAFEYSATAEGRTGEVAVDGIDLDGEPGLIYQGPAGVFNPGRSQDPDLPGNPADETTRRYSRTAGHDRQCGGYHQISRGSNLYNHPGHGGLC